MNLNRVLAIITLAFTIPAVATSGRVQESQSESAKLQNDSSGKVKQLAALSRELDDMLAAPNLRIVEIYDTDSQGRTKKAVGRVFFTEGKSLVFYANDLSRGHSETAKVVYYVWGNKQGNLETVLNLGTLDTDDSSQKRWKFQLTDAKVLEEIDRVFVTAEPLGKARTSRPQGKKILSAYLRSPANHP